MPIDSEAANSVEERLMRLERSVATLKIVATVCTAVMAIVVLDQIFPGLTGIIPLVLLVVIIPTAVIMFISATMMLLDRMSPTRDSITGNIDHQLDQDSDKV